MKRLFLFTMIVVSCFSLQAQDVKWDSTYRPNNYKLRVEQFSSYPNSGNDIIFLGNSITANVDWSELLERHDVKNRGISGDITFGVLERLNEVTEGKPAKVFILIGINDISRNIPDSIIVRNHRLIVSRIKAGSPRTKIYFQTLLPVNNEFTQFKNHYNKDEHILFVNNELRKLAETEKITLIDLYPHFLNAAKKLDGKYTQDGLHLNAAGYKVWKEILAPYLSVPAFDKQAHRGGRGLMPENTIPAMLNAIDLGVNTLEMDVVISADKKVVVSHDVYFNENITTLPNGKFLAKKEAPAYLLYSMTYDSISKFDVGMKPHPDFTKQQKIPVHKPLLADLIKAVETRAKGRMLYNIEIKSKPENDGKKHPPVEEFVDLAVAVMQAGGILPRTTIQSFDPRALQVVHRKYPSVVTSLLIEGTDKRSLDEQLQQLGFVPQVYSPHFSLVTPQLLQQCHQKGMRVIPWTVNNKAEIERLRDLGVDGVITDYPDLYEGL
ncbi:MAG TPA: glycerophosphodiester phosphodiesterase family protein [Chitinophagaceae bacterium]|nr:glycerophosphodiester phosphodiesterase family protein [Chitinophagaceae bacterium]